MKRTFHSSNAAPQNSHQHEGNLSSINESIYSTRKRNSSAVPSVVSSLYCTSNDNSQMSTVANESGATTIDTALTSITLSHTQTQNQQQHHEETHVLDVSVHGGTNSSLNMTSSPAEISSENSQV
ncbi:hypothetical protein FDP41_003638 [Naegleria fowleri]|uniref:Uncharacterized protein n=1 Tax=Naegleria fowleri TaxID=5763 RepID=A0A6A5BRA4_NAEFO|nr:uncharacterized protein FDP41_003638 [Naegleria fowleri]KAF0977646.1 hypothetical protein FDP41_003638 [Naegleria fowleri]